METVFIYKNKPYYFLKAPFNLKNNIKYSMMGRLWSPYDCDKLSLDFKEKNSLPKKGWWMPVNGRNNFVLRRLKGENVYEVYDKELDETLPVPDYLWEHQKLMYRHITQRRNVIVSAEPRTGKTLPVLLSLDPKKSAWFVTTKSAIRGIHEEIKKWNIDLPFLKIYTYAMFSKYDDLPEQIVFDECHALRNSGTTRTKKAIEIAHNQAIIFKDTIRVLMSGTPVPKNTCDWYNLTEIAQPGFLSARNRDTFDSELAVWDTTDTGMNYYKTFIKWNKEKVLEMPKRLKGLNISIFFKDVFKDIAPLSVKEHNCTPSEEQIDMLKVLRNHSDYNKGAKLQMMMRQVADGFLYNKDEEPIEFKTGKDSELSDLLDLEDLAETCRIVIYTAFTYSIDKIVRLCIAKGWSVLRIDGRGHKAMNTIHGKDTLFKEMDSSTDKGEIRKVAIVAQEDSGGSGLEFSSSKLSIGYSNSVKAEAYLQAKERSHSANNKSKDITWYNLNCMYIDHYMFERLKQKQDVQNVSLGDLQAAIKFDLSKGTNLKMKGN